MENICIRTLILDDYYRGYYELLSQLTDAPKLSFNDFKKQYYQIKNKNYSEIFVMYDTHANLIIGSTTILFEDKFIRKNALYGHIEDVIINKKYRGLKLGKKLVNHVVIYAKKMGCYKILLSCSDKNIAFYNKFGFIKNENNMVLYTTSK